MKILVCVKQVPARDSNLRVDTSGKWLDESDLTYEINEPDAYALEEALQLREKVGGEVIVLSSAPSASRRRSARLWPRARTARFIFELENVPRLIPSPTQICLRRRFGQNLRT